jgi:hypothetical protein
MLRVVDRVRLMAIPTWVGELPETIQNQATQTMVAHCLGASLPSMASARTLIQRA